MPIAGTLLTAGGTTSPTGSVNTASVTPGANRLILIDIQAATGGGTAPPVPTVTGNGLTWVQVSTVTYTDSASETHRFTRFRAMGASPSAGVINIAHSTAPNSSMAWSVHEYPDVDTTGTHGSGAIVQSATATGTGTAVSRSLSAFGDATNNAAVLGVASFGGTITPEGGWTGYTQNSYFAQQRTMWRSGEDTTPTATLSTSNPWAAIATEIKAAAGGGTVEDADGASAGIAAASGVSGAIAQVLGAVSGVAAAAGIAAAIATSAGASAGTATTTGVGAYVVAAEGSCTAGASTAGTASAITLGTGASAGIATVSGVASAVSVGVGAGAGAASVAGVASATATTVGASAGVASVAGDGEDVGGTGGVGASAGTASVTGVASAIASAVGSSTGAAAGTGVSGATAGSVGAAAGLATVTGVGADAQVVAATYQSKYRPEWTGARRDVAAAVAQGFAAEHAAALRDVGEAGR